MEALEEVVVGAHVLAMAERQRGQRVGAGGAADAEVDAAGMQRFEHLEALGDHQRRVVRQHHAAGADAEVPVAAAMAPIMISGAPLATEGRLWCSATQ